MSETENRVCSYFEPVALSCGENGGDWSIIIKFKDPDGNDHVDRVKMAEMHTSGVGLRARLENAGMRILSPRMFMKLLRSIDVSELPRGYIMRGEHGDTPFPILFLPGGQMVPKVKGRPTRDMQEASHAVGDISMSVYLERAA